MMNRKGRGRKPKFLIILNVVDLLKELRMIIIINVSHCNLFSGTNSSTVRGNIGL
jgi:hypothetical protein